MKRKLLLSTLVAAPLLTGNAFAVEANTSNTATTTHHHAVSTSSTSTAANLETPANVDAKQEASTGWLDGFSGTAAFASNYMFRGVSQTKNLPAVQTGLTYTFPIGAYLNLWGSNVKFTDTDATIELDTIAGWRGTVPIYCEELAYDLNVDRYNYPGARELNYNEFNSVFNYRIFQAGFSYSGNVYATHQTGLYYLLGINYDIPPAYFFTIEDVSVHATAGHYSLPRAAGNSYNDYSAWISKKIKHYTLTAQWTDTNGRQHNSPYDSSQLFAILNAEF